MAVYMTAASEFKELELKKRKAKSEELHFDLRTKRHQLRRIEPGERNVAIREDVDVATARLAAGELADTIGLGTIDKHCILTSVSELASNILYYAKEGTVTVKTVTRNDGCKGVEVIAKDDGPGIEDIELALQDGISTRGSIGSGLPGAKRLMSEMEIFSSLGKGTLVQTVKWMNDNHLSRFLTPSTRPKGKIK